MKSVFHGFKCKGFKHFGCKTETYRSLCQSEETKKKGKFDFRRDADRDKTVRSSTKDKSGFQDSRETSKID